MSRENENFHLYSTTCIIHPRHWKEKMKLFKVMVSAIALLATMILPAQAGNPNCNEVDGDYIVSFPRGIAIANEMRAVPGRPIQAKFTYDTVLNGFAATLTAEQVCAFQRRPGATVELDGKVQADAPNSWGLDRIDQQKLPLDNLNFNSSSSGNGVKIYIVDSGIKSDHAEFSGRLIPGFSAFVKKTVYSLSDTEDQNGHGTHVAGIAGGSTVGVAPAATLVPVRVLDNTGAGSWSGVISGLNWIAKNKSGASVANMSLGGGANKSVDTAVQNLIAAGVTVVVAAGNESRDACTRSPARVAAALTIAALANPGTGSIDSAASYSNYGRCVDVYAPGSGIYSSYNTGINDYVELSGTSMASPHVAGIVARYLELNPSATTSIISSAIISAANPKSGTIRVACLTGTNECKP